jgi:uncharacterized membrane protein YtjA (UPF0391 family)
MPLRVDPPFFRRARILAAVLTALLRKLQRIRGSRAGAAREPGMAWKLLLTAAGHTGGRKPAEGGNMLSWALTFFIVALVAAALGFGGVAGLSADIGWLFAVIGVILLVVSMVSGGITHRGPPV